MKKTQAPPSSPSGKAAAIDRMIGRLTHVIDQMPLESMISSVRFPGEPGYGDVNAAEAEATNAIKALSTLTEMGRMDAAIALRNIGNLAAKELGYALPCPTGLNSTKRDSSPEAAPNHHTVYRLPVVDIEGDLSAITDILTSEAKLIDTLSEEDIRTLVGDPRVAGQRRCVVNALSALGMNKDVLDKHRRQTSKESVHYNHPVAILGSLYSEVERRKSAIAKEKRQNRAKIAIYELIGHLIEKRLSKPSMAALEGLPSNSFEWPLCVSAFSNDISERCESLKLGHSLRFVPRGTGDKWAAKNQKTNRGRHRLFIPGEPAYFALEYCTALDDARRININASSAERQEHQSTIKRIEKHLKATENVALKIAKMANSDKKEELEAEIEAFYRGQNLRILWTLKAALLPEFPYPERGSAEAAKQDLQLWVDAAFARARMMCSNDWDGYRAWPKCVQDRIPQKVLAFVVVKEKLKEGMERLEMVVQAGP